MEYHRLTTFLEKIQSVISAKYLEKKHIIESVYLYAKIEIKEENIEVQGNILRIKISGSQKAALILRKKEILEKINLSRKNTLVNIL
ncbi:MAG: hypothetical protein MUD00_00750 [Candidatus Pacebacteria bacterium]|jgi:hypothetical protein|nr:hypothetical protein [Candidatus Paceibacterota bacterium]